MVFSGDKSTVAELAGAADAFFSSCKRWLVSCFFASSIKPLILSRDDAISDKLAVVFPDPLVALNPELPVPLGVDVNSNGIVDNLIRKTGYI